jgi:mRNA interferase MazF
MQVNQKELVLLPYPFSNFEGTKVRPALVVSKEDFNKKSADCLMVPLTSVIKDEPYSVIIDNKDLLSGEIARQSRIRADKIFCVEKSLVSMKIGKINDKTFEKVKSEIFKMF